MSKTITISLDNDYKNKSIELVNILKKSKSRVFRDMIDFFLFHKKDLSNGISIKVIE